MNCVIFRLNQDTETLCFTYNEFNSLTEFIELFKEYEQPYEILSDFLEQVDESLDLTDFNDVVYDLEIYLDKYQQDTSIDFLTTIKLD